MSGQPAGKSIGTSSVGVARDDAVTVLGDDFGAGAGADAGAGAGGGMGAVAARAADAAAGGAAEGCVSIERVVDTTASGTFGVVRATLIRPITRDGLGAVSAVDVFALATTACEPVARGKAWRVDEDAVLGGGIADDDFATLFASVKPRCG